MNVISVAAFVVIGVLDLHAGDGVAVSVHVPPELPASVLRQAQLVAAQMIAQAGVRIDWHRGGLSNSQLTCERVIVVNLTTETPKQFKPNALAFALPYEGAHITIFYDRVRENPDPVLTPKLLAHVLAHEITHILAGSDRHSSEGIMKARWTRKDYDEMVRHPLPFLEEDLVSIQNGFKKVLASDPERCLSVFKSEMGAESVPPSFEWIDPLHSRKAQKISVGSMDHSPGLNRQRR